MKHSPSSTRRRVPLLLALSAFIASIAGAWIPSVWADEGATVSAATRSPEALVALLGNIDAVHGAYYFFMHAWFSLVPVTEFTLRLPSAIAVAITAYLLWKLCSTWGGTPWALCTVIVFIALPRVTWMGIEGRSSAISTLCAVGATLMLLWWIDDPRPLRLIGYGLVISAGIYIHLYLVFLVMAHALSVLMQRIDGKRKIQFLTAAGAIAVLCSPLILLAQRQSAQIGEGSSWGTWLRQFFVNQFFLGETPVDGDLWRLSALLLAATGWGLAVVGIVTRDELRVRVISVALPWLLLPAGIVIGLSVVGQDLYHPRYFAFCAPAIALVIGRGISVLPQIWHRVTALVVMCALAVPIYASQRTPYAKSGYDWSQVAAYIRTNAHLGDGVYYAPVPTTRTIGITFPSEFVATVDLTLNVPPSEDGSLAGSSHPLASSLTSGSPDVVWAIWRSDYIDKDADSAIFDQQGYRPVRVWTQPRTEVVEFVRDE